MADTTINPTIVEIDGVKGIYVNKYTIKKDSEPLSDAKIVYNDDDWEWREEFKPLTAEELKSFEKIIEENTVPDRLCEVEATADEIVLFLADSIGGANAN